MPEDTSITPPQAPLLPYSTPSSEVLVALEPLTVRHVAIRLFVWTAVCAVGAAPSVMLAYQGFSKAGMAVGIAFFALAHTALSCVPTVRRFYRMRFAKVAVHTAYGLRIAVSAAFPMGMAIDLMPGMLFVGLVERITGAAESFPGTLLITLLMGSTISVYVLLFMGLVFVSCRAIARVGKR